MERHVHTSSHNLWMMAPRMVPITTTICMEQHLQLRNVADMANVPIAQIIRRGIAMALDLANTQMKADGKVDFEDPLWPTLQD